MFISQDDYDVLVALARFVLDNEEIFREAGRCVFCLNEQKHRKDCLFAEVTAVYASL